MGLYDIHAHASKRHAEFQKKHGLSSVKSTAAKQVAGEKYIGTGAKQKRHPEYRNNSLYHEALKHASKVNNEVRDILHKGYSTATNAGHHEQLKQHLLHTYIKGNSQHSLPYVKVHGTGGHDKPASAHATDPSDNEMYHKIKNAHHLSFHKAGNDGIAIHAHEHEHDKVGKKAFRLQVKHNNGPLTNISVNAS